MLRLDTTLVRGDFSLRAGCAFGEGVHLIRGRIGSGKSTLASALAGLEPAEGIEWTGGRRVLLMQMPEYHLTESSLEKEAASWGVTGSEEAFGLFPHYAEMKARDPFTLSRGELKRFLLACMLSCGADLLVLDEPYASLDADAKEMLTLLLRKRSGTVIVFSHEPAALPHTDWKITGGELKCLTSASGF
ncbi:MAG: ATP-binding cassette domain-containing protein [Methanocorpusculum sp.]|nr:ATP-binding cassette domain-containing protein [Methanocorpusculum sp.]